MCHQAIRFHALRDGGRGAGPDSALPLSWPIFRSVRASRRARLRVALAFMPAPSVRREDAATSTDPRSRSSRTPPLKQRHPHRNCLELHALIRITHPIRVIRSSETIQHWRIMLQRRMRLCLTTCFPLVRRVPSISSLSALRLFNACTLWLCDFQLTVETAFCLP